MATPEHNLQTQVKKWVRECVAEPHVFLAFDRTRKMSMGQHIREAARGLRRGTPDTVLMFRARWMWVEMKANDNTTSDAQDELHAEMLGIGHRVHVCWSVTDYFRACQAEGIRLAQWAEARADGLDALLRGGAVKVAKPKRSTTKPRARRPSSRALAIATQSQLPGWGRS